MIQVLSVTTSLVVIVKTQADPSLSPKVEGKEKIKMAVIQGIALVTLLIGLGLAGASENFGFKHLRLSK